MRWCVPACLTCKRAGACPREGRQAPVPPARTVQIRGQDHEPHRAVKPVVAGDLTTAYAILKCGKITTRQEQDRVSLWRPKPYRYWCEDHSKWEPLQPKQSLAPLPDEPMF